MAPMTAAVPAVTGMDSVAVITPVVATISRIGWIGVREVIGSVIGVATVRVVASVIAGIEAARIVAPAIMAAAVKASAMEAAAPTMKATAAMGLGLVGKAQGTQAGKNENNFFHFYTFVWLVLRSAFSTEELSYFGMAESKRIVLFTLPPVREIDLVGAVDVFTSANRAVGGNRPMT
jgi:hypothetical protein